MMKNLFYASVLAASFATVGCEKAASMAGSAGSSAKAAGSDALSKARDEVTKNFDLKAIEDKVATLSGSAKETATAKLADFKKLLEEFKAAPMEKLGEWKDKLAKSFAELKTSAGL